VRLRPATSDDVPAVVALELGVFDVEAWSAATVAAELLGPDRVALVAEDDAVAADDKGAAVIGYLVLMTAGDVADLNRIVVRPGRQREGVASALLDTGTARVLERGVHRLILEVAENNAGALAFYARRGFREISRRDRYYRDGSAAIVMEMWPPRPRRR
jgi:[ribosomal protein S18]-alanine N-acetyltransferase